MNDEWISAWEREQAREATKEAKPESDDVHAPSHYCRGNIECIHAIKASMTLEAYRGYLKGNVLKYLWRYDIKGDRMQNLKKAGVYLGWLMDEEDV